MILKEIQNKLEEIDPNVFYGMADELKEGELWNYIVFNRSLLKSTGNNTGYSAVYGVHVVRENFIPEGLETTIIDKMKEIAGIRLAGTDMRYDYTMKPKTNTVIEIFSVEFVKPVKA